MLHPRSAGKNDDVIGRNDDTGLLFLGGKKKIWGSILKMFKWKQRARLIPVFPSVVIVGTTAKTVGMCSLFLRAVKHYLLRY